MRILYITYIDMESVNSGSSVRPVKMLEAMLKEEHEVILLSGEQTNKKRNKNVLMVLKRILKTRPDLCYIESPVYPIMKCSDRILIRLIHKLKIPIGYFYRDFYRKFPEQFPHKKRRLGKIKDLYLDYLQNKTDRTLKFCDIIYFPSRKATELFHYKKMKPLPPACSPNVTQGKRKINYTCIYVGGILNQYDGTLLLNAFDELYKTNPGYRLILVCREREWNDFEHKSKEAPWLEVHHASGNELKPLYKRSTIGLIVPNIKMSYNSFLVSVKLFEYIGEGLPVVSVEGAAMKSIIEEDKIGLTCKSDARDMARTIDYLMNNKELYSFFQKQVIEKASKKHSWQARVKTVVSDLCPFYSKHGQ